MLECEGLEAWYDVAHVLFGLSFRVAAGEVVCLLGRNGAGKSTCLKAIMGLLPGVRGRIRFQNQDIVGRPAFEIARLGIGYVPEERRIFADLTVAENLEIAQRRGRNDAGWTLARAYEAFPALGQYRRRLGGRLSGGQQQMLTIARALMGNPALLLLDEPTEGLSPLVVQSLETLILQLKATGLTMLIAAQDVPFAFRTADRICLVNRGRMPYQGTIDEARRDVDAIRSRLAV